MKQFVLLFLLAILPSTLAANQIVKYHYWFNNNYADKEVVEVTPTDTLELDFELPISDLPPGFHFLHVMFEDESGKYSAPEASYFLIPHDIPDYENSKVVGYEYWFNENFANRQYIQTSEEDTLELDLEFDVSQLTHGLNFINIRYRSSDSLWSVPETNYFVIPIQLDFTVDYQIVGYEFWFNSDFANRQYTEVAETDTLELDFELEVGHLPQGMHLVSKRFKTSDSTWSVAETTYFIIPFEFEGNSDYDMVGYEYWFNSDFENRHYIEVSATDTIEFEELIDIDNLPNGIHLFNYRVRADDDNWSIPITDYFNSSFLTNLVGSSNYVKGIKYWFDGESDKNYIYYHDSLVYELNIEQDIDVDNIIGNRTIFIHAIDSSGYQSLPITFDFRNSFTFEIDKNIVTFDIPEISGYQYQWNFGDGNSSTLPNPTHVYKKGGTFDVRLILTRGTPSIKDTLIEQVTITLVTNEIMLSQGWNMISTYVIPDEFDIDSIFSEIGDNMVIMKNNAGQIYYPAFGINDIGDWDITQGYQVFMSQPETLSILGVQVIPESTTINLSAGWNMIAYLRNSPMDIELTLASLTDDDNLIIAKDNFGNVYFPAFEINMIGNMLPGQGYQIFIINSDTLVYPEN